MITGFSILVVVLALVGLGIFLFRKFNDCYDSQGYAVLGIILIVVFGLWTIIHVSIWVSVPYDYNTYEARRQAFIQTLDDARERGTDLENATILRDISRWNQDLATLKYENTLMIYDWCIDDRVNNLEPIK